jgi:hypothetical protein
MARRDTATRGWGARGPTVEAISASDRERCQSAGFGLLATRFGEEQGDCSGIG